jgi:AbrB family looped-hinge helix DNA binding protein
LISVWFTTKGQVVIPAWLRRQFQIENGTKAVVRAAPEGILLKPVTAASIRRLRGHGELGNSKTFRQHASST